MKGDDDEGVVAGRLVAQLLADRSARSVEGVVTRLLAVQAQDDRGARLAVRSRSSSLAASDVDDALTGKRSLVTTWLNRGTLHLVAANDYWWLHRLTTPQLTGANRRRLRQEGVSPTQAERGTAVVVEAVTSDGPQTREQLRRRLDRAGVPTVGQALVHILAAASLAGHTVRGPMVGNEQAYVSVPAWLGTGPPLSDGVQALAMLGRRYLAGHAPASAADLAQWAGVRLGDARRAFGAIAEELTPFGGGFVTLDAFAAAPLPPPRLLGPFDPLLHGWASRELFVGRHARTVTRGGVFRPVALVDGRVAATWGLSGGVISITLLEPISSGALDALIDDAADVLRFLGLPDRAVIVKGPRR